jgi:hypothetical protein
MKKHLPISKNTINKTKIIGGKTWDLKQNTVVSQKVEKVDWYLFLVYQFFNGALAIYDLSVMMSSPWLLAVDGFECIVNCKLIN